MTALRESSCLPAPGRQPVFIVRDCNLPFKFQLRIAKPLGAAPNRARTGQVLSSACFSTLPGKVMYDENDLIYSPLQQKYTAEGKTVEVCIYRMPDTGWTLEVVDQYNNSTVWDGEFNTDQEAFDLFLEEVNSEGIEAMIGPEPGSAVH